MRRQSIAGFIWLVAALYGPRAIAASLPTPNLSLDRFDATPAGDSQLGVDSPDVRGDLQLGAKLTADWAHNPLSFRVVSTQKTASLLVQNQFVLNVGLSLALFNRILVSADLPMDVAQSGVGARLGAINLPPPSGFHLADLRLGVRVFVYTWRPLLRFGVQGYVWLPLGSSSDASGLFTSDGHVRGRAELLLGGEDSVLYWSAALGPDFRHQAIFYGISQGSTMRINASAGVRLFDGALAVGPEVYLALPFQDVSRYNRNYELLIGAHYTLVRDLVVGVGAGPGFGSGIGTPDVRIVASLGYAAPLMDEPAPPPAPPSDADQDGIVDSADACPMAAGVPSADPNQHGCPLSAPVDADHDGILDAVDACPTVVGVPSADPNTHGCPLPPPPPPEAPAVAAPPAAPAPPVDSDHDGIPDAVDACPTEAGILSADPNKSGCPTGAVVGDQIVMLEPIKFKTGSAQILKESTALLETLLLSLKKLAATNHYRIEGHTDARGDRLKNVNLSQRRAAAVITWLVAHGMDIGQLSAKGLGPDVPIATNKTEAGRQINRRVEIHIEK